MSINITENQGRKYLAYTMQKYNFVHIKNKWSDGIETIAAPLMFNNNGKIRVILEMLIVDDYYMFTKDMYYGIVGDKLLLKMDPIKSVNGQIMIGDAYYIDNSGDIVSKMGNFGITMTNSLMKTLKKIEWSAEEKAEIEKLNNNFTKFL